MASFDTTAYRRVLAVRCALRFDFGGLLMRIYVCMATMGTITMCTLSGYGFLQAGTIASTVAIATLVIAPKISAQVDRLGQMKVVPLASLLTCLGLGGLILCVSLQGPWWVCYPAAVLMGFIPMPQSLVRARWSYLVRSGKLGPNAPDMQTVLSYEGVLDDASFMFGPSVSIALAAAITPVAGMVFGLLCIALGAVIMLSSRDTEPEPGWDCVLSQAEDARVGEGEQSANTKRKSRGSALLVYPIVGVSFVLMCLQGCHFGVFDTTIMAYVEQINWTEFASMLLPPASVVSIAMGFLFGMARFTWSPRTQFMATSLFLGCTYGLMFLVTDVVSLSVIYLIAAFSYAPFVITLNSLVERTVPGSRLTESLTWLNSGNTMGMALGPTLGGYVCDVAGSLVGFDVAAIFALVIPVVALGILLARRNFLA